MRASTNLEIAVAANVSERFAIADARPGTACMPNEREGRCRRLIRINAQSRSTSSLGSLVELEMASGLEARRLWSISRIVRAKSRLRHLINLRAALGPASKQRPPGSAGAVRSY
jgi:hypothetical protein